MKSGPTTSAWRPTTVSAAPLVELDGDLYSVLRRLAARYYAKAKKLSLVPAARASAEFYRHAGDSVTALIPATEAVTA